MRYQLLLWDEVYRLWYFNDHITTLLISEKSAICYLYKIQKVQRRFHIYCLIDIYRERDMETSGMVNL